MRPEARALALIIAILSVSHGAAAAPFLQIGGGPTRTGILSDPGPASDDIAFIRSLAGAPIPNAPPIIIGTNVYVLTQAQNPGDQNGIWRIRTTVATTDVLHAFTATPTSIASDGGLAYVTTERDVEAIALADGRVVWTYALAGARANCAAPAVDHGVVYLFCTNADLAVGSDFYAEGSIVAIALQATSGRAVWTRAIDDPTSAQRDPTGGLAAQGRSEIPTRVSVIGDHLFLVATASGPGQASVYALDRATGAPAWSKPQPLLLRDDLTGIAYRPDSAASIARSQAPGWPSYVVGDRDEIYVAMGHDLYAYNSASGAYAWSVFLPFDAQADTVYNTNFALALTGSEILASQYSMLWTIERGSNHTLAAHDTGQTIDGFGLLVANNTIITSAGRFDTATLVGTSTKYAESAVTFELNGTLRWARPYPPWAAFLPSAANARVTELQQSVGEGLSVTLVGRGALVVIGTTPASIAASARVANAYPAVGAIAEADLSGTRPGIDGPATEFRADWDDGAATDWQSDPHLSHVYLEKGERTAKFEARNAANQTATTTASYHVGAAAPLKPTLLARALDPAYQNVTFGIIGLAATGAGGLVALLARRRRRTLLARELRALDDARARLGDDGPGWRADVAHRRAHYATLLRKRRIDSGELLVLERHIEVLSGTEAAVQAPRVEVGVTLLERYRIDRMLGEGGQGRVYLARDLTIGRDVVVKAVPTLGLGGQAKRLLLAEARLAGSIDHANVVRVFDVIEAPQEAYLVLEYVDGGTLRSRLARGPIPRAEALSIFRGILAGLAATHERGIVHGDLKPENVLLTRTGVPKIADFGTAREAGVDATMAAVRIGTLRYMTPEQVRGRAPDARSDLYAATAILVEMLTGASPLGTGAMDDFQIRAKILDGPRGDLPLGERNEDLRAMVVRGLATDPAQRYQSAAQMLAALPP